MTIDNTSSSQPVINDGVTGIVKALEVNNGDTFPFDVWVPQADKKVIVDDIILNLQEKTGSGKTAIFELEIRYGGAWVDLAEVGIVGDGFSGVNHSFSGKVQTDKGNGSNPRVRINKINATDSTNFKIHIVVVGREV